MEATAENFYAHFLNQLYGWKLENINTETQNAEAIDLIDHHNKLIVQVSATNRKNKVDSSLSKIDTIKYAGYTFKFVSIANDADNLKQAAYTLPNGISFTPQIDVIDKNILLKHILPMPVEVQFGVYMFIKKELGNEGESIRLDSNLATIINILAKEDLAGGTHEQKTAFNIESKITHNQLLHTKGLIDDYKIHHHTVDGIYQVFDKQGTNQSLSVLHAISQVYTKELVKGSSNSDELFLNSIANVMEKVKESANFVHIKEEELDLCVSILVVDAFIRCKIFENPENYRHASSRQHTS